MTIFELKLVELEVDLKKKNLLAIFSLHFLSESLENLAKNNIL